MRSDLLGGVRARRRRRVAALGLGMGAVALAAAFAWHSGALPETQPAAFGAGAANAGDGQAAEGSSAQGNGAARAEATGSAASHPGLRSGEPGDEAVDPGTADGAAVRAAPRTRPVVQWLADLAGEAGLDLVVSPDLRGDLTAADAHGLGWRERLDAYARVFGFEARVGDGLLEVTRPPPAAALRASAAGSRGVPGDGARDAAGGPGDAAGGGADPAESGADGRARGGATGNPGNGSGAPGAAAPPADALAEVPPETRVVALVHATARDVAAALARTGDALDVTAAAEVSSNTLVLTGAAAGVARVARVVAQLDRPRRRIELEARIVEMTRSARLDLGVEWKVAADPVGADVKFPPALGDAGSAALLVATGGASALNARLTALEARGLLHVVSRPSVVMLEGSPATIESVRILRIRLPSRGAVVGDEVVESPSSGRATEDIPVGVRLEVTPSLRGPGRVLLRIRAKSSSLGAPLPPDDIPEELSRMVDAEVMVASGETAVLGGLSREAGSSTGSGVPVLGRLPGLGALFGRRSRVGEEEELLILVTPRLLD